MPDRFDDIRADAACCAREYDTDKEKDSSLTDDWKADRLQPGRYWVKNTKGGIMPDVYMANREWMYSQTEYVEEVLAPCNYDHFVELTQKAEKFEKAFIKALQNNDELSAVITGNELEIDHLRQLLKESIRLISYEHEVYEAENFIKEVDEVLK